MRSLWGKAPFQFQLREIPMPEPDPGEVLVNPDLLVSHTFSLDEHENAFRTLTDPQQAAIKVVLAPRRHDFDESDPSLKGATHVPS